MHTHRFHPAPAVILLRPARPPVRLSTSPPPPSHLPLQPATVNPLFPSPNSSPSLSDSWRIFRATSGERTKYDELAEGEKSSFVCGGRSAQKRPASAGGRRAARDIAKMTSLASSQERLGRPWSILIFAGVGLVLLMQREETEKEIFAKPFLETACTVMEGQRRERDKFHNLARRVNFGRCSARETRNNVDVAQLGHYDGWRGEDAPSPVSPVWLAER